MQNQNDFKKGRILWQGLITAYFGTKYLLMQFRRWSTMMHSYQLCVGDDRPYDDSASKLCNGASA